MPHWKWSSLKTLKQNSWRSYHSLLCFCFEDKPFSYVYSIIGSNEHLLYLFLHMLCHMLLLLTCHKLFWNTIPSYMVGFWALDGALSLAPTLEHMTSCNPSVHFILYTHTHTHTDTHTHKHRHTHRVVVGSGEQYCPQFGQLAKYLRLLFRTQRSSLCMLALNTRDNKHWNVRPPYRERQSVHCRR